MSPSKNGRLPFWRLPLSPKLKSNVVPSYRLHKQSGQAIVTLSGRDRTLGAYGTSASKEKYKRLIAEWLSNNRKPALPTPTAAEDGLKTVELIASFWQRQVLTMYRRPDGKPANYRHALSPLKELYGRTVANAFGPLALDAVVTEMVRRQWSRKVINHHLTRIKRLFKWGVGKELIDDRVYQRFSTVEGLRRGQHGAKELERVKPVEDAVFVATLPFFARHIAAMVDLQLLTGMRPGEVCMLRRRDIDTSGEVWLYKPPHHKTVHHDIERIIHIGPRAQEVLTSFLKPDLDAHLFSPADAEQERLQVRYAKRRTPMSCGNIPGSQRREKPAQRPNTEDCARVLKEMIGGLGQLKYVRAGTETCQESRAIGAASRKNRLLPARAGGAVVATTRVSVVARAKRG